MVVPTIIYGTRCKVNIQPSGGGASTLAYSFEASVREVSMSGGERSVEEIKTLGNNEILRQNPQQPMEVELTTLKTDTRLWEAIAGGSDTQYKQLTGSMPFIVDGDDSRRFWRVWIEASGESADDWILRLLWNDSYGVNIDKAVDAEGFIEETVTFKCTADDYTEEWSGSYTTNALSTLPSY